MWHRDTMKQSSWKTTAQEAGLGTAPEPWELYERSVVRQGEREVTEQGLHLGTEEVGVEGRGRGKGWRREIQLVCMLLAIQRRTFSLRSHQLSNWESDGDGRAAGISTRPELGTPLRPNQNTITFTARTDTHGPAPEHSHSRAATLLVVPSFYTNTVRHTYTWSCTHRQKNISFKSHMGEHILSHAITLWSISNYPLLKGREMMSKTQFNIDSYLSLWPMTWVYLHYAAVHF